MVELLPQDPPLQHYQFLKWFMMFSEFVKKELKCDTFSDTEKGKTL